jgi:ferredoxin
MCYTVLMSIKVWIDQDLCTGDGLCGEIAPEIFEGHDDGLFYVKETSWPSILDDGSGAKPEPIYQMASGMADVPDRLVDAVVESAEECPGECIFLEVD